jgi:HlyD family secretion protein
VLADFSQWVVETDDLTEIEVPEIAVGQMVEVTPDALPELQLSGRVESIGELYEEKRGDVTYTARILLDEGDERLRWGMTVVVVFVEE